MMVVVVVVVVPRRGLGLMRLMRLMRLIGGPSVATVARKSVCERGSVGGRGGGGGQFLSTPQQRLL